ncbi:hypothetical protein SWYG_00078 [Synechococcus phage S-IOM18]|uniref:DUF6321 domain-containing protein n=1 Tax=Synechococcus phage S-IOM18 TaxID=754039 RepID=R9TN14_9CAUD|nr:hypothetical protein SWYG_00078 [Synechococcus phage S-IOM18]AGN33590.1 hypothetical protein SWYG_00078 [Synechococcus phage S-IOM18]
MAQGFQSDIPPAINQTAKKYIRGMMKGKSRWNRLYGSRDKEVMHKTANKMAMGEMQKMPPTYSDVFGGNSDGQLQEKAKSKAQQRFMGLVRRAQKTGEASSPEVAKAASSMSKSDVKDYASTKHKGLPEKKRVEEGNKSGDSSLRDWFGKSKSSDGKPGWVQLGGKYAGKPCAKQPGQTTKPKCGSSKMKRNLNKDEEERAFRRKNRQDPNPDRKGKAINVKTEDLDLQKMSKELAGASKMHKGQSERIKKHLKKMQKEATYPSDFRNPDGSKRAVAKKKTGRPNAQGDYGKKDIQERGDFWHPDEKEDRKLGGPGANQRAREDRAAASKPTAKKADPKKLKPGESYMDYAKRQKGGSSLSAKPKKKSLLGRLGLKKEEVEVQEGMGDVAIKAIRATQGKKPAELSKRTALIRKIKQKQLDSYLAKRDKKKSERVTNVGMGEELEWLTEEQFDEAAGEKDACYKKVKARYSVWPSAYASGALVKCRKVGAANWGNKTKKEEFNRFQQVQEKCWVGYKQVGMKKKGKKMVPNCVPEEVQNEGAAWTKKAGQNSEGGLNEKGRKSYERENPGSDLKRPSKKVGNKRRASFCARMKGMRKRQKPSNNTGEDRLSKSLRAWNC